jgi:ribonucleoside-diphosphate reductase alpha subunit
MQATHPPTFFVTKRDGRLEPVDKEQIYARYAKLANDRGIADKVDARWVGDSVALALADKITTRQLDEIAEKICAHSNPSVPYYHQLAAQIKLDNLWKDVPAGWLEALCKFQDCPSNGMYPSPSLCTYARQHAAIFEDALQHHRDKGYDYSSIHILESQYLLRLLNGNIGERIQHMWMRLACALTLHLEDPSETLEVYELLSTHRICLPTPVVRCAGTGLPNVISCFLAECPDDLDGMYLKALDFAHCSKLGGGFGLSINKVRSRGTTINSTGGEAQGVGPFAYVLNAIKRHVIQGSNQRAGALALYLQPWHGDFFEFLDLKKTTQDPRYRCAEIFFHLWMPDLLRKRAERDEQWSLFTPSDFPALDELYGDAFERAYIEAEAEGKAVATIHAKSVYRAIATLLITTGGPGVMNKDIINELSSLKHQGPTTNGNLCTEITIRSEGVAKACCILGAIGLPAHVKDGKMDLRMLRRSARKLTRLVDRLCDLAVYPDEPTKKLHLRNRPLGIGVNGLADVFALMEVAWEDGEAQVLNHQIFEHIHWACVKESVRLSQQFGACDGFEGSPLSSGQLHPTQWSRYMQASGRTFRDDLRALNWPRLGERVRKTGMRNMLLNAPMPTASSSRLVGNNECFEPYTSNVYSRKLSAGDFYIVNPHLVRLLEKKGVLGEEVIQQMEEDRGSVKNLQCLTEREKKLFKTAWEIPGMVLTQMAAYRQPYIDQSQSFNLWMEVPTVSKVASHLVNSSRLGIKTSIYYFHTKPAAFMLDYGGRLTESTKPANLASELAENAIFCTSGGCVS